VKIDLIFLELKLEDWQEIGGHKQAHTAGRIKESQTDRHGLVCELSYTSQKQRKVL